MFPIRFNSPEKWLRGLPVGRTVSNENWVSIPPRSGSGDYTGVGCIIVHGRFQYPLEVALGNTAGGSSEFRTASFNSPEKWLWGLQNPFCVDRLDVSFNSPEKWLWGIHDHQRRQPTQKFQSPREVTQGNTAIWLRPHD